MDGLEKDPAELEEYLKRKMQPVTPEEQAGYDARFASAERANNRADQANLMAGLLSASSKFGMGSEPDTKPLMASAQQAQGRAQDIENKTYGQIDGRRKERLMAMEDYLKTKHEDKRRISEFDEKKKQRAEEMKMRKEERDEDRQWRSEQNALARAAASQKLSDKPPTDSQMNAAAFGTKAKDADGVIAQVEAAGYDPSSHARTARSLPGLGQFTMSDEDRQYEQAQKEFIAAILRKESGGAITPDEFTEYGKIYFPQPGDGPDVRAQKSAARRRATESLIAQSGKAATQIPSNPYQVPARKPAAGEAMASGGNKSLDEMTPEEMEAELRALEAENAGAQ